ncbi:MAG: hypothetical protein U0324_04265 [Polyangiales bacterium]
MRSGPRLALALTPTLALAVSLATLAQEPAWRVADLLRKGGASAALLVVAVASAWALLTRDAWRRGGGRDEGVSASLFAASLPWAAGCFALLAASLSPTVPAYDGAPLSASLLTTFAPALFAHRVGACASAALLLAAAAVRWRLAPSRDPFAAGLGAAAAFFAFGLAWHEVDFELAHLRDQVAFARQWAAAVALAAGAAAATAAHSLRAACADEATMTRAQGPYREGMHAPTERAADDPGAALALLAGLACLAAGAWFSSAAALERAGLSERHWPGRKVYFPAIESWTVADVATARAFTGAVTLCAAIALAGALAVALRRRRAPWGALLAAIAVVAGDGLAFTAVRSARAARLDGQLDPAVVYEGAFRPVLLPDATPLAPEVRRWVRLSGDALRLDRGPTVSLRDEATLAMALSALLAGAPAPRTLAVVPEAGTSWAQFERVAHAASAAGVTRLVVIGTPVGLDDGMAPDAAGAALPRDRSLLGRSLALDAAARSGCGLARFVRTRNLADCSLERERIPRDQRTPLPPAATVQEALAFDLRYRFLDVSLGCAPAAR